MRFFFCDDTELIKNTKLGEAFIKFCEENKNNEYELYYLTINKSGDNYLSIYYYNKDNYDWALINDVIENVKTEEDVFTCIESIISLKQNKNCFLLDTKWFMDEEETVISEKKNIVKNGIILWIKKNYDLYEKVFVYTTFGFFDAESFMNDLIEDGIKIPLKEPVAISPAPWEQKYDLIKVFTASITEQNDK